MVLVLGLLSVCPAQAEEQGAALGQQEHCQVLANQLEAQNQQLHQELRQIKREIAALNQNLENPGVREIMSGIGYIFGLCGVAALVSARRRGSKEH